MQDKFALPVKSNPHQDIVFIDNFYFSKTGPKLASCRNEQTALCGNSELNVRYAMDIGQIIGTTKEQPRRESEPRKEESDDFATFLNEPAPKQEALAKKETGEIEPPVKEQVAQDAPAKTPVDKPSNDQAAEPATTGTEKKAQTADTNSQTTEAQGAEAKEAKTVTVASATPAVPAIPASNSAAPEVAPEVVKAQPAQPPVQGKNNIPVDTAATVVPKTDVKADVKPETPKAEANAATVNSNPVKPGKGQAEIVAQAPLPAPAITEKPAKNNATPSHSAEKVITTGAPEPKAAPAASDVIAAVRTQAEAKMSEKDILSTKIAEMLQDGKGKVSLNSSPQAQSFQSTLASSTNLVTASMAGNATAPAMNLLPGTVSDADGIIPQVTPTVTANAGGLPTDTANPTMPAAPTGSVQGVEATASNTASQAANAARASAHLPVAEQVSTQISTAIKEGHDRIKISLHPSELGRVEVKLDIGHDGRVLAVVSVDKQETLDMLQRDARTLEKALQDAGFDTGSNSLNFGLRQDAEGEGRNFADLDLPLSEAIDESDFSMLPPQPLSSGVNGDGSLDIQV
mgnify:CR=1 FL=1